MTLVQNDSSLRNVRVLLNRLSAQEIDAHCNPPKKDCDQNDDTQTKIDRVIHLRSSKLKCQNPPTIPSKPPMTTSTNMNTVALPSVKVGDVVWRQ